MRARRTQVSSGKISFTFARSFLRNRHLRARRIGQIFDDVAGIAVTVLAIVVTNLVRQSLTSRVETEAAMAAGDADAVGQSAAASQPSAAR
jgi:hypothetical protein